MDDPIFAAFVSGLDGSLSLRVDVHEVSRLLQESVDAGVRAWPTLNLAAESFAWHIGRTLANDGDELVFAMERLHVADFFLACACVHRVVGAIETFDTVYLAPIARREPLASADTALIDEVRQNLRNRLFLGSGTNAPKIASYSGNGALRNWVAVVARREAYSLLRRERPRDRELTDDVMALLPSACDPEIEYLRGRYRSELEEAFRAGFRKLMPRDRLIMRLNIIQGLSMGKIGLIYGVNQSTVSRWMHAARETVREEIHRIVAERLFIDPEELVSLIRQLPSSVELSMAATLTNHELAAN
jgi:RNA polymerase sigma-70 factor, ECF subfamily